MNKKIAYNGDEIVLVEISTVKKKNLIILGNGFSLGDPGISMPKAKDYSRLGVTLAMFFRKDCSGLEAAQEELAHFINSKYHNYKDVVVYGHSKCGVMFYNMLSLIPSPITSISVSAPFNGSFWADEDAVLKRLEENKLSLHRLVYKRIFSNHNVDKDIIEGSKYLSTKRFIPDFHTVANVVTQCFDVQYELSKGNFGQAFFSYLNKIAQYDSGDGIVSVKSQKANTAVKSDFLWASHMNSFNRARSFLYYFLHS